MKSFLQSQENHKDIVRLSFTKEEANQLEWEEEQEFRYNDEMYDVIEKKVSGNQIIIRCIADKKETNLLHEYQKHTNGNSSNLSVVQLVTANFILPDDHLLQQPVKIITRQFIDYSSSLQNPPSNIFPPPPDVC